MIKIIDVFKKDLDVRTCRNMSISMENIKNAKISTCIAYANQKMFSQEENEIVLNREFSFILSLSDNIENTLSYILGNTDVIHVSRFICNTFGDIECSELGNKISNGLIRVAATRIFSDPEQSIMELPVNSIDSYNIKNGLPSVGKFGMGFFSILYWIAQPLNGEYPRFLEIFSTYREKDELKSYRVKLKWTFQGLEFSRLNLLKNSIRKIDKTTGNFSDETSEGTEITLNCEKFELTQKEISNMKKQLERLYFIEGANLFLKDEKNIISRLNEGSFDDSVLISFDKNIAISDNASGIPLELLYNSLLVPSSSSKARRKINRDVRPSELNFLKNGDKSYFYIIVNGVVIVNIKLDKYLQSYEYLIFLPEGSKLPVSRDDIIYEKDSIEIQVLEEQLMNLVNIAIEKQRSIYQFIDFLDLYILKNSQEELFKTVTRVKNSILQRNDILLIPVFFGEIYELLVQHIPKKIVYHPSPNFYEIEKEMNEHLMNISDRQIFKLKKVLFIDLKDGKKIETFGLSSFIFIDKKSKNNDFYSNAIISNDKTLLFPVNVSYNVDIFENFEFPTPRGIYNPNDNEIYLRKQNDAKQFIQSNSKIMDVLRIFFMTFAKKTQNIKFEEKNYFKIEFIYFASLLDLSKSESVDIICNYVENFNGKISQINFDFPYGVEQKITLIIIKDTYTNLKDYLIEGQFSFSVSKLKKYLYDLERTEIIDMLTEILQDYEADDSPSNTIDDKNNAIRELTKTYKDIARENQNSVDWNIIFELLDEAEKSNNVERTYPNTENLDRLLNEITIKLYFYNIELISTEISNQCFIPYLYGFKNNFLSTEYIRQDLINEMYEGLSLCITNAEYFVYLHTIKIFIVDNNMNKESVYTGIGKFLLNEIRRKISSVELENLVKYWSKTNNRTSFHNSVVDPLKISLKSYTDSLNSVRMRENKYEFENTGYNFTAKSLLAYIYEHEIDVNNQVTDDLLENLVDYKNNVFEYSNVKLQIGEIAVNAGTTKSFIRAVLTELIQNSIDAIRSTSNENKKIDVYIHSNIVEIIDYVGMKNFISLLIPFLSSKNVDDPNVTGEMGTGFFNVFRQPYVK